MDPLTLGLIMGGTTLANMYMQNEQNKQIANQNKINGIMAAEQTRYSPWTGAGHGKFSPESQKSMVGAGMQGALTGASFAQAYDAAQSQKNLADSQADYMKSMQSSPWFSNAKTIGNRHQMAGGNMGYGA